MHFDFVNRLVEIVWGFGFKVWFRVKVMAKVQGERKSKGKVQGKG